MTSPSEMNEELLRIVLPENYQYQIHGVSVRELAEVSSEVKLEAHFWVNVENKDGLDKFLSDFSKCSGTSYNKSNQCDRSGKIASLYGIRKCIHNVCTQNKNGDNAIHKKANLHTAHKSRPCISGGGG